MGNTKNSIDHSINKEPIKTEKKCQSGCQRRMSVLLHTHVILIIVCLLAALDAVCVIGQLICDILIMREKLDHFEHIEDELTTVLFDYIPNLNESLHPKWNLDAILAVLKGSGHHHEDGPLPTPSFNASGFLLSNSSFPPVLPDVLSLQALHRHRRAAAPEVPGHEVEHGLLYHLTHFFHLGSMVILSLLLLETLFKVFAMGKKLRHHKLEVFDALVVTISWSLDVAFYEGIWAHPGTTAATILIYMLPWRVIRIVNSFVLVIQEKDQVQLKIVKQRLRQSIKKSKEAGDRTHVLRHEVKALAGLCRKLGAGEPEISACSPSGHMSRLGWLSSGLMSHFGKGNTRRRSSVHSVLERAASLTFISTLSSMGSLPSLFDMGDVSSEEEDDQSNQHETLDRKSSHAPTLKSALSSTTLDSGSVVLSIDNDNHRSESPAYDSTSQSSKSSSSPVSSDKDSVKRPVVWTSSGESIPPSYHIAVAQTNSNTRL